MGRQKKFIDPDAHFFRFLGRLRAAGRSNMYGAIPYLAEEFRVPRDEAYRVVCRWVDEREQNGDAPAEPRRSTFRWLSEPPSAAAAADQRAGPARAPRAPRVEQIAMPLTAPAATVVHRPAVRGKPRRVVSREAAVAAKPHPVAGRRTAAGKQKPAARAVAKPASGRIPKPKPAAVGTVASPAAAKPAPSRRVAVGKPVSKPSAKVASKPPVKTEKQAKPGKAEKRVKAPAKQPVASQPVVKPVVKPVAERAKRAA